MKDLIILGAGGAGFDIVSIVCHINRTKPTWNILGFLDDDCNLIGKKILGYKVLGTIDLCRSYPNAFFISSIAHPNNRLIRKKIYEKVKDAKGRFATIIHPSAVIYEEVDIGEGTVINANTTIGTKVVLGVDIHLAYGCNIGHEAEIGGHCSLGAGVNFSSNVDIGECCYIGCGVSSAHDIKIEANTLVTVGSAIVRSLRNKEKDVVNTWIGNPAENSYIYMRKQHALDKLIRK